MRRARGPLGDDEALPSARHGRQRRRSGLRSGLAMVALFAAVVLVSAVGITAWAVNDVAASFKPSVSLVGGDGESAPPVPDINAIEGGLSVLLVGSDTRKGQGGRYGSEDEIQGHRNDVTILLHISEDHSNAVAVSIPRDMYVSIPSCTDSDGKEHAPRQRAKVNESLNIGGLSCTWETVQKLTGVDIHYAAEVTFEGVTAMADAVGGVEVCIENGIHDPKTDLDLPAGDVKLSGRQAAQFLRTRHGVGDGSDIGRISNQQVYMSALVRSLKSSETLSNPVTLYRIAKVAAKNVTLSDGLQNPNTMVSIALALGEVPSENFSLVQYPVTDSGDGVAPLPQDEQVLLDALQNDDGLAITGGTGRYGSHAKDADDDSDDADDGDAGDDGADGSSTPTPSPSETDSHVELPDSVRGQTVDDVRCSAGRG